LTAFIQLVHWIICAQVWLMLKAELMAPAALEDTKQQQEQQLLNPKQDLATKAAASLQASVAALGPGLLDQQVLNDVAVEDLMQYLGLVNPPWGLTNQATAAEGEAGGGAGGETEGWHLPARAQRRLACIASCVAAVSFGLGWVTSQLCL
jgi:hypothetical protein